MKKLLIMITLLAISLNAPADNEALQGAFLGTVIGGAAGGGKGAAIGFGVGLGTGAIIESERNRDREYREERRQERRERKRERRNYYRSENNDLDTQMDIAIGPRVSEYPRAHSRRYRDRDDALLQTQEDQENLTNYEPEISPHYHEYWNWEKEGFYGPERYEIEMGPGNNVDTTEYGNEFETNPKLARPVRPVLNAAEDLAEGTAETVEDITAPVVEGTGDVVTGTENAVEDVTEPVARTTKNIVNSIL